MELKCTPQRKFLAYLGQVQFCALAAIIILSLSGCAAPQNESTFVRQKTDLRYVKKVAVLPFTNNTSDKFAAQRIRDITTTQILSMGIFDVVDEGVVDSALREMAIGKDKPMDTPILKRLGQRLGVQAFIDGTVNDIGTNKSGPFSYPEVSLTLKLVDSESAEILWQSSAHRNGYSVWERLFDLDPQDSFQLALILTRDMLATIPK
ncbi:MAG: hypothetical protein GXP57_08590 [Deltaproteobacteria bacterium]|nr:hypothetical protein [Deltaproteobacteria bacterium]